MNGRRLGAGLVLAGLLTAGGCGAGSSDAAKYVRPTIAVMKFENRAPVSMGWDLGSGMRDILVDRLCATGRFHVVERPELASVLRELDIQNSGVTRAQGRGRPGRVKNVRYLVKGTITDFGHVATQRGFLGLPTLESLGSSRRAVMGVTLYVVDVESAEVISSESIEESVRASETSLKATYGNVAFGGSVFYSTPLGRATAKVIDRAVAGIVETIASRPWRPKIALVRDDGTVIINGGRDRRVRAGSHYEVYEQGDPIVDPDTGDVIGHQPGARVGEIRIRQVAERYSVAGIWDGAPKRFRVGQHCRPVAASRGRVGVRALSELPR